MFWSLNLRLFQKLVQRHVERDRRDDQRAGTIAAAVYNSTRSKVSDKVWTWEDLFPQRAKREQTDEEMLALFTVFEGRQGRLTRGKRAAEQ